MFHASISQLTTSRWELRQEIARVAAHGFDCLSLWRPKLSDVGPAAAATLLADAGLRASSLQWAGGFTGGDGRSLADSIDDAVDAIEAAASVAAPTLVIHSGCRGGHTRAHARRLLVEALETLAPIAQAAGVTLALRPLHAAAAGGCSFLTHPGDALEIVEQLADPAIRLALDLWQFGDDAEMPRLLPRLATVAAVVQVADRIGPPTIEIERLPAGRGGLPLESLVLDLVDHGYEGTFEFDPIGMEVAALGYEAVLEETRHAVERLGEAVEQRLRWHHATTAVWQIASLRSATGAAGPAVAPPRWDGLQCRSAGSRRSQASSQTVSRG